MPNNWILNYLVLLQSLFHELISSRTVLYMLPKKVGDSFWKEKNLKEKIYCEKTVCIGKQTIRQYSFQPLVEPRYPEPSCYLLPLIGPVPAVGRF